MNKSSRLLFVVEKKIRKEVMMLLPGIDMYKEGGEVNKDKE
jgi:hypothetical protein